MSSSIHSEQQSTKITHTLLMNTDKNNLCIIQLNYTKNFVAFSDIVSSNTNIILIQEPSYSFIGSQPTNGKPQNIYGMPNHVQYFSFFPLSINKYENQLVHIVMFVSKKLDYSQFTIDNDWSEGLNIVTIH